MAAFIESHEFEISISYHAYGNLVIWPWGYDYLYTPDEEVFAQLGDSTTAWNNYSPGVGWTLYLVNGDTDDWAYGEQTSKNKIYALTFEVGSGDDGFWPDPSRIPDMIAENLQPNLFLARTAGAQEYLRAPGKPEMFLASEVDSTGFSVDWTPLTDSLNPAVAYELLELRGRQTVTDEAADFDNWTNEGFVVSSDRSYSGGTSFYSTQGDGMHNTITSRVSGLACWFALFISWILILAYLRLDT